MKYGVSEYARFLSDEISDRIPRRGIGHIITGDALALSPALNTVMEALASGPFSAAYFEGSTELRSCFRALRTMRLVIPYGVDELAGFAAWYPRRPLQSAAFAFRRSGRPYLAYVPTTRRRFGAPSTDDDVVFDEIDEPTFALFTVATGDRPLRDIAALLQLDIDALLARVSALAEYDRQALKLAPKPCTDVPFTASVNQALRDLVHARPRGAEGDLAEYHRHGIHASDRQFDAAEPTIAHALRFPSAVFDGVSYGMRFCDALFSASPPPAVGRVRILEVGGGTGSFAASFIERAVTHYALAGRLAYDICELSPALAVAQREKLVATLADVQVTVSDALDVPLPDRAYDYVVANEMIADLPCDRDATCNAGALAFLRRIIPAVRQGGALVLTEYGTISGPILPSRHLDHMEWSIRFGDLAAVAREQGCAVRLEPLGSFLKPSDPQLLCVQQDQLTTLNAILKPSAALPAAAFGMAEIPPDVRDMLLALQVKGLTEAPRSAGYHYGPAMDGFFALTALLF